VKNEDKIDESHKSQLKFEYEIYLLNYTIKIKKPKKPTLGFCGFLRFFKNLKGFLKPTSTALSITRGHNLKLANNRYHYDLRKLSFGPRIVNVWKIARNDNISRYNRGALTPNFYGLGLEDPSLGFGLKKRPALTIFWHHSETQSRQLLL